MSLLRPHYSFSSLSPEPSQSFSQNTRSNPEEGVRRVTIKQLLTAQYEAHKNTFRIDQQPLGKLILVANVYKNQFILSKSRISYGFDDGSGRIGGYESAAETEMKAPKFPLFAYASIVGQLTKAPDGSVYVKVLHILPVIDPHEIYFHILHIIFDDLRYENGDPSREDWLANQSFDQTEIQDLASALDSIDISSSPLSELEQSIIIRIHDLKEYWEAHGDMENLHRGIQIGSLVQELAPVHQDQVAQDFLIAIERLLVMDVLQTTIDDEHLGFAERFAY